MKIDNRAIATKRLDAVDQGIVLSHKGGPDQCDKFGARDVWVFKENDTYYMHYDAAGDVGWLAALAISSDGVHWEKKGTILELGEPHEPDSKSASYATTYHEDGIWHLFYMGTPNCSPAPDRIPAFPYLTLKAKSDSPTGPWVKQRDVRPLTTVEGTYYSVTVTPGTIVQAENKYIQFFSAATIADGITKRTISLAETTDLNASWVVRDTPILPLDEQIENVVVHFEQESNTWFLFTNHVGIEQLENGNVVEYTDAIWVYWSRDLYQWNPENKAIVLDRNNCNWSPTIIGLPSIIPIGDRLAIYYDGNKNEDYYHMQRDIGLAWLDLPLTIPQ